MDVSISWRFYPVHCFGCNKLASWIRMELPSNAIVYCSEQCLKTSVTSNSGGYANVSVNPASQSMVGLGASNQIMGKLEWPFLVAPSSSAGPGPAASVDKTETPGTTPPTPDPVTSNIPDSTEIPRVSEIAYSKYTASSIGGIDFNDWGNDADFHAPAPKIVDDIASGDPEISPARPAASGDKTETAGTAPQTPDPVTRSTLGNTEIPTVPEIAYSKYTASAIDEMGYDYWGNDANFRAPAAAPKFFDDIAKGDAQISHAGPAASVDKTKTHGITPPTPDPVTSSIAGNTVIPSVPEIAYSKYTASAIDEIDFDDWGNDANFRSPAPKIVDDIAKGDAEISPVAFNKLDKMNTFGLMHMGDARVVHIYSASRFHIIGTSEEVQQERTLLDRLIRKGLKNKRFQPFKDAGRMLDAYRNKEVFIVMKGDKCGRGFITAWDPEDKLCQIEFIDNGERVVMNLDDEGLFIPTEDVMDEPLYGLAVNLFEVTKDHKIPEALEKLLPTLVVTVEFFEGKPTYDGNVYLEVPGEEEPYSLNMTLVLHQH